MSKRFRAVVIPTSTKSINPNRCSVVGNLSSNTPDNRVDDITMTTSNRRSSRFAAKAEVDDDEDEFMFVAEPILNGSKRTATGRASTTSASTIDDSADASEATTPLTSAAPTPAPSIKQEAPNAITELRGSRRYTRHSDTTGDDVPESHKRAFERARKAREDRARAEAAVLGKRKRLNSDEDDDFDLVDDDADTKFARDLQEAEYAKLDPMDGDTESEVPLAMSRKGGNRRSLKTSPSLEVPGTASEFDLSAISQSIQKNRLVRRSVKKSKIEVEDSEDDASEFALSADDFQTFSKRSVKSSTIVDNKSNVKGKQKIVKGDGKAAKRYSRKGSATIPNIKRESTVDSLSTALSEGALDAILAADSDAEASYIATEDEDDDDLAGILPNAPPRALFNRPYQRQRPHPGRVESRALSMDRRAKQDRARLEEQHPEILTMWDDLKNLEPIKSKKVEQPKNINRQLKPFQLEGLGWMQEMEKTSWGGGLLGDEMGMGKTIQAVSLIMSDWPAKTPSLVLVPPVALMQWQQEIAEYTDGTLKVFVHHGTNKAAKNMTLAELKKYDVILLSYNSLESMHRFEVSGRKKKENGVEKMVYQKSVMHLIKFHRVILDEAHSIKARQTGVARACFALKADHKWCLSGTPLQNRIGEFFSLVRFLDIRPFACYMCRQCPCSTLNWGMDASNKCKECNHHGMQHVSVFNQELLNPIQKYGNKGAGKVAFDKLRLLTDRFMLRRVKRDHSSSMELPSKEIIVNRQFFGEVENDFAGSIMNNNVRKFETYVAQGVMLNNYANIFGLIMQMRQVANHPDLILKKSSVGGANIIHCCVCDETAEDAIRSACKHDFCRECAKNYQVTMAKSGLDVECPRCNIGLSIDLEQPAMEQNETDVKKNSIINRIKMENWTSSSKIEALVHELHSLRSNKGSSKSIIFSQFSTMLQLVEWRLRRAGITTVMLDGSMTPAQRQASINKFMTDTKVECFLVSLKAGGVALNLTEASKVFLIDPWWNPAAEWQSADRCHRIGQARPCTVTRLCIEDSVESRMVQLQEKKANMINSTINSDESAMESLTPEDMQFLFRGN